MKVPIGISARHIHLCKKDLEILFGDNYELTRFKDLSQPGQYACEERVNIRTKDGKEIKNVRILGPLRSETQVEISRSDAIRLRIDPPVRASGDLGGSTGITLEGPNGETTLTQGVIVANRHIHMHTDDAAKFNLRDKEVVSVKVEGIKGGIMDNVTVRVNEAYALDMHIDTDDACAFDLKNKDLVQIIK